MKIYFDDVTVTSFINIGYGSVKVSHNEQRSVICFWWAKGLSANAI